MAVVLASRAALVNATDIEPEAVILFLNVIAIACLFVRQELAVGPTAVAGFFLGLSIAARPSAILPLIALGIWIGWTAMREGGSGRCKRVLLAWFGASLIPVLVVVMANLGLTGSPVIMNPGMVFYEGLNPYAIGYGGIQPRIVNDLEDELREPDSLHIAYRVVHAKATGAESLDPDAANEFWTGKAFSFATSFPETVVERLTTKMFLAVHSYESWDLITMARKDRELSQYPIWISFGACVTLALFGPLVPGSRRSMAAPLIVWVLTTGIVMLLFYVSSRQRLAVLPGLAMLVGIGVENLFGFWRERRLKRLAVAGVLMSLLLVTLSAKYIWQSEDDHNWSSVFANRALSQQSTAATNAGEALDGEVLRAAAETWPTRSQLPILARSPVLSNVAGRHVREVESHARAFDLVLTFERLGEWQRADEMLELLSDEGYRPIRETITASSISYHRALAAIHLGREVEVRALLDRATDEAVGDADVLALRYVALDDDESLERLTELHDPFSSQYALALAMHHLGRDDRAIEMLRAIDRSIPQWTRPVRMLRAIAARGGRTEEPAHGTEEPVSQGTR